MKTAKVVSLPTAFKSVPNTITKHEFYRALYNFMAEIKVVETPEQFRKLADAECEYLEYFVKHYVSLN